MSDDRGKPTFSELDRRRREGGAGHGPRGRRAPEEEGRATRAALEQADSLFSDAPGGREGEQLAKAMRDAHGSPAFPDACRSYCAEFGVPDDLALLALLLDTGERELVVPALEALLAAREAGSLEIGSGLRSQLRILAQAPDDTVAGISEELLED